MSSKSKMHSLSRRGLLKAGPGAFALAGMDKLGGCSSFRPIRVAIQPWCGYQFIPAAKMQGLLTTSAESHAPIAQCNSEEVSKKAKFAKPENILLPLLAICQPSIAN